MHTYLRRRGAEVLSITVLFLSVSVPLASASTLLTENFGVGSTSATIPGWTQNGAGAQARAAGIGNNSASPDGDRFALLLGTDGSICRTIRTVGFKATQLSYYWRGDANAQNTDRGIVEIKPVGRGVTCADTTGWIQLKSHNMNINGAWSVQAPFGNVAMDNTTFLIRFRDASNRPSESFRVDGISLTGTPLNQAPVASDVVASTNEDTPAVITLDATDVDGNPLTYSIVSASAQGTLSVVSGNQVTYTPNADYNGPDSFTYKANDGSLDSNIATANITVVPVDDAPVAYDESISTNEDTVVSGTLTASDVDGPSLSFSVVTGPAHGTVSLDSAGNFTYTPTANYNGTDSFTYKANDGSFDSNIATVNLTIAPVEHAPVALNESVSISSNTPTPITLLGFDVDGDPITYSVILPPSSGTLGTITGNVVVYTPNPGFTGSDIFFYKTNDGMLNSVVAAVTLTVAP